MLLSVSADLAYDFPERSELIVSVHAATSQDQWVISERLDTQPEASIISPAVPWSVASRR